MGGTSSLSLKFYFLNACNGSPSCVLKFEHVLLVHSFCDVFESLSGFKVGSMREFFPIL